MLSASVVPEGHGIGLPLKSTLKNGILEVLVQILENGIALVTRDANEAIGEHSVHIQSLLFRHRMGTNNRVRGARVLLLISDPVVCVEAAIKSLSVMYC